MNTLFTDDSERELSGLVRAWLLESELSLNTGLVAIEGSHLGDVPELLEQCGYIINHKETLKTGAAWKAASRRSADADTTVMTAYEADGWTVILDPDMNLAGAGGFLSGCAKLFRTKVCGIICAETTNTYVFALYSARGEKTRLIESQNEEITRVEGGALLNEPDITQSGFGEDETIGMLRQVGVFFDSFTVERQYVSFTLTEAGAPEKKSGRSTMHKPWWKFW